MRSILFSPTHSILQSFRFFSFVSMSWEKRISNHLCHHRQHFCYHLGVNIVVVVLFLFHIYDVHPCYSLIYIDRSFSSRCRSGKKIQLKKKYLRILSKVYDKFTKPNYYHLKKHIDFMNFIHHNSKIAISPLNQWFFLSDNIPSAKRPLFDIY